MTARAPRRFLRRAGAAACLVTLFLAVPLVPLAGVGRAATSSIPLTGSIHGPSQLGESLNGTYVISASGGPAVTPNGTQTGALSFRASITGAAGSAASVLPAAGVLTNGSAKVVVRAPNTTGTITLTAVVTSTQNATNASINLTMAIVVVQPYVVRTSLLVESSIGVGAFAITVTLDGAPVGQVSVPTLSGGSRYQVAFSYVATNLATGYHTFGMNLAEEHGLVVFANGSEQFTETFYVAGPTLDNTIWFVTGTVALLGAFLIWLARVGGRRRGRGKK